MKLSKRPGLLWILLLLATITTVLFVACGSTSTTANPTSTAGTQSTMSAATQTVQVQIIEQNGQYSFNPATITVPKGAEVIWTNNSDAPHTVTSDTNAFGTTSNLNAKQTFTAMFNTPGAFAYHCNIHTYMKGTVNVTQ